jgi:rfaE bifunctional protein kinase chain/domain
MPDIRSTIQNRFPGKKVVVVGDLVADQFLNGTISRVSREAPVFILRHDETDTVPGAAANAAVNIASLGGTAELIGVVGKDANGELLLSALRDSGVDTSSVIADGSISTTTKVRVLAGRDFAVRQQVIRIDYEHAGIGDYIKSQLRERLATSAASANAIIVSDYNYGAVFPELYEDALAISRDRNIPLIVDSRFRLNELTGATSATPNREEAEALLGKGFNDIDCESLRAGSNYKALLVTHGNEGMTLFEAGRPAIHLVAIGGSEPVDVTGAGDTVIAAYSLGLASGLSFGDAATIANHAGGIVVMKKGTASVTPVELVTSLDKYDSLATSSSTS